MKVICLRSAIVLLFSVVTVNAFELYDTFDRTNSTDVGYTEKVYGGRWVEVGDNDSDNLIMLYNNSVIQFYYMNSLPNLSDIAVNVGGFCSSETHLYVKCKPYSSYYGGWYGVGYRMPNQMSKWNLSTSGYYVRLDAKSSQNKIYLYYGNDTVVASANVTIPTTSYSLLEIVASGTNHKVYFGENLVIDVNHAGETGSGYVGLWSYYSISYWDDFSVIDANSGMQFSDDFNRVSSDEVGMMFRGGSWEWQESGENVNDDITKIVDNKLDFHYFRSSPTSSSVTANIKNYEIADVDISINAKPYSSSYGQYYGLSYRLTSPSNKFCMSDGYYVQINKNSQNLTLWYNTTQVAQASVTIPDGYSRIRALAQGNSHKIFWQPSSLDTFTRVNSNTLGQINGYSWNEVGDNVNGNLIKIANNEVVMDYQASTPAVGSLAANISNYIATDVDISVKIKPYSDSYGTSYGVSYRCPSVNNKYIDLEGYHVVLNKQSDKVYLKYGTTTLADANWIISANYSTLRVTARGSQHKVYIDNICVLQKTDTTSLTPGYLGIFAYYSIAYFDDFSVIGRDVEAAIDVTDSSRTTQGYLGIFDYYSITQFDDFKVEVLPSVYPKSTEFPLMVYTQDTHLDMDKERVFGWNIGHSYDSDSNKIEIASRDSSERYFCVMPYDINVTDTKAAQFVNSKENDSYLCWWDVPEELRWWISDEWDMFIVDCNAARTHDRDLRPREMYIPVHYDQNNVAKYVPYVDIVPSSCYTTFAKMPHAWVRWRIEETKRGIVDANCILGSNYLNGQKTVFGIVEIYHEPNSPIMTPEGAYHDFWQSIVSGAKGIGVYAWAYRNDYPNYKRNWDMYCRAASELTGPEQLDHVILDGTELQDPGITYNSGTTQTPSFVPVGTNDPSQQYASVDMLYLSEDSTKYLLTVSSATGSCNATITGLPASATSAKVLFEGRSVSITEGALTDNWDPLAVHIYKIN